MVTGVCIHVTDVCLWLHGSPWSCKSEALASQTTPATDYQDLIYGLKLSHELNHKQSKLGMSVEYV